MGLGLEVGILADLKVNDEEGYEYFLEQFDIVNRVLADEGVGAHQEPHAIDEVRDWEMYGYSGLHYLRRVAAHLVMNGALPEPGDSDAARDPILDSQYPDRFFSEPSTEFQHLIIHSDAEGFYVPVDFERAIIADEGYDLVGGMLGSTQRLLKECSELARSLEMPIETDPEADEIWEATEEQGEGDETWQRYGVETFTSLRLIAACRASIETGAAITFV